MNEDMETELKSFVFKNVAIIYLQKNEQDKAAQALDWIIHNFPPNDLPIANYLWLAEYWQLKNEPQKMTEVLTAAQKRPATAVETLGVSFFLAEANRLLNKCSITAYDEIIKSTETNPYKGRARLSKGICLAASSDLTNAQKEFEGLATKYANQRIGYLAQVWGWQCMFNIGDAAKAVPLIEKFATANRQNREAADAVRLAGFFGIEHAFEDSGKDTALQARFVRCEQAALRWLQMYPEAKNTPEGLGARYRRALMKEYQVAQITNFGSGNVSVTYDAFRVFPQQFETAVCVMGCEIERLVVRPGLALAGANIQYTESAMATCLIPNTKHRS